MHHPPSLAAVVGALDGHQIKLAKWMLARLVSIVLPREPLSMLVACRIAHQTNNSTPSLNFVLNNAAATAAAALPALDALEPTDHVLLDEHAMAEHLISLIDHLARLSTTPRSRHLLVLTRATNASAWSTALQAAAEHNIDVWFAVFPASSHDIGSCATAVQVAHTLQDWALEAFAVQGSTCMEHLCMQLVRALATQTLSTSLVLVGGSSIACELVPTLYPITAGQGQVSQLCERMLHGAAILLVPDCTAVMGIDDDCQVSHSERMLGALATELLHRTQALVIESPCDLEAITCGHTAATPHASDPLFAVKYLYILMALPAVDNHMHPTSPTHTQQDHTNHALPHAPAAGAMVLKRLACSEELLPMVPEALQPAEQPTAEDHALVCSMLDGVPCAASTPAWLLQLSNGIEHAVRAAARSMAASRARVAPAVEAVKQPARKGRRGGGGGQRNNSRAASGPTLGLTTTRRR